MPVKEESKQGDVEDKLIRMDSVTYGNSLNFQRIDDMASKDNFQVPLKSPSYLLKKAEVPIKHVAQSENEVAKPDLSRYELTYDDLINYYCDFDKEAQMYQNEEF